MKFKTKLYVGYGAVLALILVMSYIGLQGLERLQSGIQQIVTENYAGVKRATSIRGEINNIGRVMNALLLEQDEERYKEHLQAIASSREKISEDWSALQTLKPSQERTDFQARFDTLYTDYLKSLDKLVDLMEKGKREAALDLFYMETETKRAELFDVIRGFNGMYERDMGDVLASSHKEYELLRNAFIGLIVFIFLVAVLIAGWVLRSVTKSLRKISTGMNLVSFNDTSRLPRIEVTSDDEIGSIAAAFNQMASSLELHTANVRQYQKTLEEQHWHQSMVGEFSALFQGVQDVQRLAELFVNKVAAMMDAGYGVVYVHEGPLDGPKKLWKAASYAVDGDPPGEKQFAPGQSLVGQCAKENKPIVLNEVPQHFIPIRSGLGTAAPSHVILLPIPFEDKAVGVLEMASFRPFDEAKLRALEEVMMVLGMAMNGAFSYMQIQKLLGESQTFTEELQAQSEELQLQQEELRTLNEQLEEQYKDTDRKNKELEGIKHELEEKNRQVLLGSRYKSEFLANVSHELRTPLNSLLLLTQLLKDNKEGNLFPKQLEYLRTIHASGTDLLNLISEILDLSKIESGKMELVPEIVSLQEIGDIARSQFMPAAMQKGLEFRVELHDNTGSLSIYTDRQKLQQIVTNLLANAFKFTEAGSVVLSFRLAQPESAPQDAEPERSGSHLAVSVSDTGIGIAKEQQEMVFEAFRQADGTTSRKYGGTGLGLSICKEIANLLGGRIDLDSEEGQGSTFTLIMPIKTIGGAQFPEQAYAESAVSTDWFPRMEEDAYEYAEELQGRTVLVVDDDMRNIFALTGALENLGVRVLFAENGQEGLEQLERYPEIDLVLMDIMMPKMDGYEAMKAIRGSDAPYRDLPIIALTAKAMKNDREKCIEAGANDYISKPVQYEQLLSLLRVWLHR
ncbi:Sensor histidine kinase RcsC [Paenibacillus sp. CECT 9249]|uniref:response regulator n=1 Tax=Paenibacillus sp. CECT 9249 TaxID=2845385 RepID=UPI001E5FBFE7|nr:response regulator [Paenibacillus sp. CECT 9249]CAH0120165.1 Sensor histidine kinase RcsC [Paenibacillus sp. CECT 9249]